MDRAKENKQGKIKPLDLATARNPDHPRLKGARGLNSVQNSKGVALAIGKGCLTELRALVKGHS